MGVTVRGKEEEKVPILSGSLRGSQESVYCGREQNLLVIDHSKNVGWAWCLIFGQFLCRFPAFESHLLEKEEETFYMEERLIVSPVPQRDD